MLAVPWYFNTRHEASFFNAAYGIITLAVLFWGLYAGTLVDQYNRKKLFLWLNLSCGLAFAFISGYGYGTEGVPSSLILAVFGITMLNYNIHYPTLYSIGQEISDPSGYARFNSNIEVVGQSVSILSGGLAALLLDGINQNFNIRLPGLEVIYPIKIEAWSIRQIIGMNAIAHFIAAIMILFIRYKPSASRVKESGHVFSRLVTGFNYLRHRPEIFWFGLLSYSVFAMLMVEIHAVLPGFIERHLEEGGHVFALADMIYAVGAFLAGIGVSRLFARTSSDVSVLILTIATAGIFIWNGISASVWVVYIMSFLLGFTNAGIRVLRLTYLFQRVDNEVIGRVNSLFNMLNILIRALFIFLFSSVFFTVSNNIRFGYLIMAAFLLISACGIWWVRRRNDTQSANNS